MLLLLYRNTQHHVTEVRNVRNICFQAVSPHLIITHRLLPTRMIRTSPISESCSAKPINTKVKLTLSDVSCYARCLHLPGGFCDGPFSFSVQLQYTRLSNEHRSVSADGSWLLRKDSSFGRDFSQAVAPMSRDYVRI